MSIFTSLTNKRVQNRNILVRKWNVVWLHRTLFYLIQLVVTENCSHLLSFVCFEQKQNLFIGLECSLKIWFLIWSFEIYESWSDSIDAIKIKWIHRAIFVSSASFSCSHTACLTKKRAGNCSILVPKWNVFLAEQHIAKFFIPFNIAGCPGTFVTKIWFFVCNFLDKKIGQKT